MQLREKIHDAINKMSPQALTLVYEQIKLLEDMKFVFQRKRIKKSRYTLDKVHELTSTSKSCWSDTVIEDREDRV